jgi:hypothetical protein
MLKKKEWDFQLGIIAVRSDHVETLKSGDELDN